MAVSNTYDIMTTEKRRYNDAKLLIFLICAVYCFERNDPLLTRDWNKIKRAVVFNPVTDKIIEFLINKL